MADPLLVILACLFFATPAALAVMIDRGAGRLVEPPDRGSVTLAAT